MSKYHGCMNYYYNTLPMVLPNPFFKSYIDSIRRFGSLAKGIAERLLHILSSLEFVMPALL